MSCGTFYRYKRVAESGKMRVHDDSYRSSLLRIALFCSVSHLALSRGNNSQSLVPTASRSSIVIP